MPKVKLPRKSTAIDMTAMCDVAFLLLSFFIFTAKSKSAEELPANPPSSVASDVSTAKNSINVTVDAKGRVVMGVFPEAKRAAFAKKLDADLQLGLSPQEIEAFKKKEQVGMPRETLKSYLGLFAADDKAKKEPDGIPTDSAKGELVTWINAAKSVFTNPSEDSLVIFVKGDVNTKFPAFQSVIDAFRRTNTFKFKLITMPEDVPPGTELYKDNLKGIKQKD